MDKKIVQVYNVGGNELPLYSTKLSAGFDIRVDFSNLKVYDEIPGNGKFELTLTNDDEMILLLHPGGRVLLPTGLHVAIPDNYELQVRPRSGLALKNGITIMNSPATIDSDYRGLLGLIMVNTDTTESFEIRHGDRLAQGVLNKVKQVVWERVNSVEELGITDRGQGGFGHTGKN